MNLVAVSPGFTTLSEFGWMPQLRPATNWKVWELLGKSSKIWRTSHIGVAVSCWLLTSRFASLFTWIILDPNRFKYSATWLGLGDRIGSHRASASRGASVLGRRFSSRFPHLPTDISDMFLTGVFIFSSASSSQV